MGGLSNFEEVLTYFSSNGYRSIMLVLLMYSLPLVKTNIKNLAKFWTRFLAHMELDNITLTGNSLGVMCLWSTYHPTVYTTLPGPEVPGQGESAVGDSDHLAEGRLRRSGKSGRAPYRKEVATMGWSK